nr:MAG TPA: hypothetical protein [Bacteriophage sp.]
MIKGRFYIGLSLIYEDKGVFPFPSIRYLHSSLRVATLTRLNKIY